MIDIGVASRARRTGDNQNRNGCDETVREPWFWSPDCPRCEGQDCYRNDRWYEPGGNLIRKPLNWRAAALRLRYHLHDLREHSIASDLICSHDEAARLIYRGADDFVTYCLCDRHGLPVTIDLSMELAIDDGPIDGNTFSGTYAQLVTDLDLIESHILVRAIRS